MDLAADGTSATTFASDFVEGDDEPDVELEEALAPPELEELELLLLLLLLPQPAIIATHTSGTAAAQKPLHPGISLLLG